MPFDSHSKPVSPIDRRRFLGITGLGGAALLLGGRRALFAEDYDPAAVSLMEFDVTYRTAVMNLPKDAEDVHIWMPVPVSDRWQTVSDSPWTRPFPMSTGGRKRSGIASCT